MIKKKQKSTMNKIAIHISRVLIFIFSINCSAQVKHPNIVYVFADQWRAQATGYSGDRNARTPNLDKMASDGLNFVNAISCEASCTPYRASLMTGQYPTTHGLILNDLRLNPGAESLGKQFKGAGYNTAYIGKWHLDGPYREAFIPKERRQGFDYWKVMECTHDYLNSYYYENTPLKKEWEGYDAHAQAKDACAYIKKHAKDDKPFCLFLSWGPPHFPYKEVPQKYLDLYADKSKILLRPNVPENVKTTALDQLQGYYAHIAALDEAMGWILKTIKDQGIEENTIVVFTADHGDMLGSHGRYYKSVWYDEATCVPFLLKYPAIKGSKGKKISMPINTPDIMPTLLGLCNIPIPYEVEGNDFSKIITGKEKELDYSALIVSPTKNVAGFEFRGVRTKNFTYIKDLKGPLYLFDNVNDPYQMNNLVNKASFDSIQHEMEKRLSNALRVANDDFLPEYRYLDKFGIYLTPGGYPPFGENYPSLSDSLK